jgi:ligand-binding sensor domain-containing protein
MKKRFDLLLFTLASACGSERDPAPPKSELAIVPGAGTTAAFSSSEALTADGSIEAIGTSGAGHLLAVVTGQLHELEGGVLEVRSLYVGTADPEALGNVHAIAPRIGGGAWIAAEAGLFGLDAAYTVKIPLLEDEGEVFTVADAGGPLAGLWLGTGGGLFRRRAESVEKYAVPSASGAVTLFAVQGNGKTAAARIGDTLVLLEDAGGQVLTDRPPIDTGAIHAIAAGSDALYVGADRGLFVYRAGTVPWTQYTLAAQGSPAVAVRAISVDVAMGAAWARTDSGLVRLLDGALSTYAMSGGDMALLAVDNFGDVWTAGSGELGRSSVSTSMGGATFSQGVLPWIRAECSQCHMNQTQNFEDYEVFVHVAESALARVRFGDMPRCDGGLRCPTEERLQPADYAVLEQWIRDGMPK